MDDTVAVGGPPKRFAKMRTLFKRSGVSAGVVFLVVVLAGWGLFLLWLIALLISSIYGAVFGS